MSSTIQDFSIRVPKNLKRKHHVMRFNGNLNIDFTYWKNVKMERENNAKELKGAEDDLPKYGAGSEYNRDIKEEARRKKFGIVAKKYKAEAQPWILKVGNRNGKKFRGIREGGVSDNASFYVFTHAPDGAIEAYPLSEWYNFQPIQRYKTLSAEEAEHELSNRKKALNLFALMLRKRMKGEDDTEAELETEGKRLSKKKDFSISEMDDWINSDASSDSTDKESENGDIKSKPSLNKKKTTQKKNKNCDDEAFEESDDGDEEGRELDYISDTSQSDSEIEAKNKDLKSVAEEDGLRNLLTSDEEDESDVNNLDNDNEQNEDQPIKSLEFEQKSDEKEIKPKKKKRRNTNDSSSESGSDSSNIDTERDNPHKKKKNLSLKSSSKTDFFQNETSKRKFSNSLTSQLLYDSGNQSKKKKTDTSLLPSSFASVNKEDHGVTEEAVRRYLMRKPMTTIELLTKFKNKKTGVSSDKLVETMTQILKKINPTKQTIQGKMYLSIKLPK